VNAVGVLVNPTYPVAAAQLKEVQSAAASINVRLIVTNASADRDFEPAFGLLVQQGADALLVQPDPFFNSRRDQIVALAARYAVPAIYECASTPWRGPDELRNEHYRSLSPRRVLYRPGSQGREAC
jgi:DNA-binding LacI/PurR family transcriptional regulator